jgi:ABC-type sugar transport system permease subunit
MINGRKSNPLFERKMKKGFFMAAMMGPAIVGFLVFYVYVNFNSLVMAFQSKVNGEIIYGFENFRYFFTEVTYPDSIFSTAIKNTFLFFGLGYVQMALSLLVAYFVYKQIAGYKFFRFIYYVTSIIMATATALLFRFVTNVSGPFGLMYEQAYGEPMQSLWTADTGNLMLAIYIMLFGLGPNMVLFLGSMTNISPEIFEAARIDGVGWIREIVQLIIPLIWPTFSVMFLQSITGLTQATGPVFLLTSSIKETYTISYWLYQNLLDGTNLERSAAVGWCCTIVTFPIAMLVKWLLNKVEDKIGV